MRTGHCSKIMQHADVLSQRHVNHTRADKLMWEPRRTMCMWSTCAHHRCWEATKWNIQNQTGQSLRSMSMLVHGTAIMLPQPHHAQCAWTWWSCKHQMQWVLSFRQSQLWAEEFKQMWSRYCFFIRAVSAVFKKCKCLSIKTTGLINWSETRLWFPNPILNQEQRETPNGDKASCYRGKPPSLAPHCCPQKRSFVPGPMGASALWF